MNTLEFFWGEVAVMSPQHGGTHLEQGLEGRGMRALSQILSDKFLRGSTHLTYHGGALRHLLHLYFLFS